MSTELHYAKSPLIEAVIDLRVELPKSTTLDTLSSVRNEDENTYPIVQKHFQGEFELAAIGDEVTTRGTGAQTGYFFISADDRHLVQARLNGFTLSRRGQYDSWRSFQSEAQRWWSRYRELTQLERVTRLGVRYINRLELPLPFGDFREYLRTAPDIASDMPQALSGYFMQLHIPQSDAPVTLILNQAMVDVSEQNTLGVILDIDLFQDTDVPQDEEGIWSVFQWLRERKNDVFEKCITEQMKELIR